MPKGVPKKTKNRQIAEQEYERIQSRLEELDSQGKFSVLQVPKMSATRITQSYINKLKAITDDVIEYSTTEKAKHEYEVHLHRSESAKSAYWNKRLQSGDYIVDEETGELVKADDIANVNYADEGEYTNGDDTVIDNLIDAINSPDGDDEIAELFMSAIDDILPEDRHDFAERIRQQDEMQDLLASIEESLVFYSADGGQDKLDAIFRVAMVITGDNGYYSLMNKAVEIVERQKREYYSTHSSSSKRSRR